jgi:hypothetical protein
VEAARFLASFWLAVPVLVAGVRPLAPSVWVLAAGLFFASPFFCRLLPFLLLGQHFHRRTDYRRLQIRL